MSRSGIRAAICSTRRLLKQVRPNADYASTVAALLWHITCWRIPWCHHCREERSIRVDASGLPADMTPGGLVRASALERHSRQADDRRRHAKQPKMEVDQLTNLFGATRD